MKRRILSCDWVQVKLFVELFNNKFQPYMFKLLKAANEDEVVQFGREFEHQLEVGALTFLHTDVPCLAELSRFIG